VPAGKTMFSAIVRKKFTIRMVRELMTTASVVDLPTPTAPLRVESHCWHPTMATMIAKTNPLVRAITMSLPWV